MASVNEQRRQYGLSSLFWLTLVAAVLLASWRIGWQKVVPTVSLGTALLFCVIWISLLIQKLPR